MFANKSAIETLVNADTKASGEEKEQILSLLRGAVRTVCEEAQVFSIADAAKYLGKPRKAIYNLLRNGTLRGFYSGKTHARATGITRASLEAAVSRSRR